MAEIRDEILEELLKEYKKPEDLLGKSGIFKELQKRLLEKAMQGELTNHLGYEKNGKKVSDNARNGKTPKKLKTEQGIIEIETPRDRDGSFFLTVALFRFWG